MQVSLEYMIIVPLMIMQIFMFPYVATVAMSGWAESRKTIALQEIGSHIGSEITQLYSLLAHNAYQTGQVCSKIDVPNYVEGSYYNGSGYLTSSTGASDSSKILHLTLTLSGSNIKSQVTVTLGENVRWADSTYVSNSSNAQLCAEKFENGTIEFSFIS